MKTLLKIFLLSFLISSLNAQNIGWSNCDCFERIVALVEIQHRKGEHQKALENFKLAFDLAPHLKLNPRNKLKLAISYAHADSLNQALTLINEVYPILYDRAGIEIQLYETKLKDDARLLEIFNQPRKAPNPFNETYKDRLEALLDVDQSIRSEPLKSNLSYTAFREKDSLNWVNLKSLLHSFGFPSYEKHGIISDYITPIALHNLRYSEKLKDDVLSYFQSDTTCYFRKSTLAWFEDNRLASNNTNKQLFGTRLLYDDLLIPLDNPSKIDSLRFEYNLPTLYDSNPYINFPNEYLRWAYPEGYFCGALQ